MDSIKTILENLDTAIKAKDLTQIKKNYALLIQALPNPDKNQHDCFNKCPKCGATDPDIQWGDKDWQDHFGYQSATCLECGCEFTEFYRYIYSEIDTPVTRE